MLRQGFESPTLHFQWGYGNNGITSAPQAENPSSNLGGSTIIENRIMGAYSTITIDRQTAIQKILDALDEATNEEISEALFALTSDHCLDNYCVVGN